MSVKSHIKTLSMALTIALASCSSADKAAAGAPTDTFAEQGAFSADSALAFTKAQTDLGPRVPGSDAHARCVDFLTGTLNRLGADTVAILASKDVAWDGTRLDIKNIWAQFNRTASARVLLVAHYDSRPWADREDDLDARNIPIDGANDGAAGVGIILEIARNIAAQPASVGVDILFTDCEDYGIRADRETEDDTQDSWCIGSRHFAVNSPYSPAARPRFGILLDMVSGKNARFHREYYSHNYAPMPTAKVWAMARRMGFQKRFLDGVGGAVMDDHIPLIQAGIPTVDVIENRAADTEGFPATWHTHNDTYDNLDPVSMDIVGRVILNVIYNEKP